MTAQTTGQPLEQNIPQGNVPEPVEHKMVYTDAEIHTTPFVKKESEVPEVKAQINLTEEHLPKTTQKLLEELTEKVDNIELMVKKIRRHNTISMWLTIIFIVLPLVGSIFALPYLVNTYMGSMGLGDMSALVPTEEGGSSDGTPVPGKQVSDTQLLEMLRDLQSKVETQ